jgi:hypothetical protein
LTLCAVTPTRRASSAPDRPGQTAGTTLPKHPPAEVASAILDAIADGAEELIMDDRTRQLKDALPRELELTYPALERQFNASLR